MSDIKYKGMADIYNIFWLMNKMKFLRAGVDYHINKYYSDFHTLKYFIWYVNLVARRWKIILTVLNRHELLQNYPKETSLKTKNIIKQRWIMVTLQTQIKWRKTSFYPWISLNTMTLEDTITFDKVLETIPSLVQKTTQITLLIN